MDQYFHFVYQTVNSTVQYISVQYSIFIFPPPWILRQPEDTEREIKIVWPNLHSIFRLRPVHRVSSSWTCGGSWREGGRGGLSNCRFYNHFELIPQPTIHPKIYNLQYTCKIWIKSTFFAQKPKNTNLQDFGQKNMQSTSFFSSQIYSLWLYCPAPPPGRLLIIDFLRTARSKCKCK